MGFMCSTKINIQDGVSMNLIKIIHFLFLCFKKNFTIKEFQQNNTKANLHEIVNYFHFCLSNFPHQIMWDGNLINDLQQ
jgi:hypothetical protein